MSIKFGAIFDIHFGITNHFSGLFGGEFRIVESAAPRFAEAITTWNAENTDINMQSGDILDNVDFDYSTTMPAFQAEADNLTDKTKLINVLGNHQESYTPKTTRDNYFTGIADYQMTRANPWWPLLDDTNQNPWAYTIDTNGYRIIVVYQTNTFLLDDDDNDQDAWLTARLDETSLPVIVFSHSNPYSTVEGREFFRIAVENSNKVHAVFYGHSHPENFVVQREIPYFGLGGSVRNLVSLTDLTNVYYIVEMDPDTGLVGAFQPKSSINVTGFGWGTDFDLTKFSMGF